MYDDALPREPIVPFADTARRMRRFGIVLLCFLSVTVLARGVAAGNLTVSLVGESVGIALLVALAGEVIIVGTAAVRGARSAAQSGQRLSRTDVALIPPQVGRWLDRRFSVPNPPDPPATS